MNQGGYLDEKFCKNPPAALIFTTKKMLHLFTILFDMFFSPPLLFSIGTNNNKGSEASSICVTSPQTAPVTSSVKSSHLEELSSLVISHTNQAATSLFDSPEFEKQNKVSALSNSHNIISVIKYTKYFSRELFEGPKQ